MSSYTFRRSCVTCGDETSGGEFTCCDCVKKRDTELSTLRAENEKLREELREERARFDWWFSKTDALKRLTVSANGCQQKWTLEQWRAAIDEARKKGT